MCPIDPENKTWHIDELARSLQQEERKPNPVAQRVKIIMALGLAVVHIHSRFFSALTGLYFGFASSHEDEGSLVEKVVDGDVGDFIEKVPLPDYLWWKMFNLSVDQVKDEFYNRLSLYQVTCVLLLLLISNYSARTRGRVTGVSVGNSAGT